MNIIYFNPDELRSDMLGCYGNEQILTPNIDAFSSEAVQFNNCFVQNPVCTPSRASFLTGLYPHNGGHRTLWNLLDKNENNTFSYLKGKGYETCCMGKNDALTKEAADLFIDRIYHQDKDDTDNISESFSETERLNFLWESFEGENVDYHIIQEAIRYIKDERNKSRPFFLNLSLLYPHCPYTCPEQWYHMYDDVDVAIEDPLHSVNKPAFYELIRKYRGLDELDPEFFVKIKRVYMGMISYIDHLFGLLLTALKDVNLYDETAIFFFSDHGDWAGDYHLVEKWPTAMDDKILKVPMIIKAPECKAGHKSDELIECFDIMDTTFKLAGIESRHTNFSRSLLPQLSGDAGDPDRIIYAEGGYNPNEPHCYEGDNSDVICGNSSTDFTENPYAHYFQKGKLQQDIPNTVARTVVRRCQNYKLVLRADGSNELYDLKHDVHERINLYDADDVAGIQAKMKEEVLFWYINTSDTVPVQRDSRNWTY